MIACDTVSSNRTRRSDHDRITLQRNDHRSHRWSTTRSRGDSAQRRTGRCDRRQPARRRAADPPQAVALGANPASWSRSPAAAERGKPRCWRFSRDCNRPRPGKFGTTASRAVPASAPAPLSATCPRTTSSTSRCPCAARCGTRRCYGCPPAHLRSRADRIVEETLQDLDLAHRADVPVRALSGGQRKRASIAVELLTRPSLFFLDEPTSGLDPSTAADVMRLLRRLSRRGVTVVVTTHEPAGIDRCDRVVFLARDGHLAFTGEPGRGAALLRRGRAHRGVRAPGGRAHSADLGGEIRGKPPRSDNRPGLDSTAGAGRSGPA